MEWKCKLCAVTSDTRAHLFRHYRLQHSHYSRVSPLPCLHNTCICTFPSFNALKIHLTRVHKDTCRTGAGERAQVRHTLFNCPLCDFKKPFSEVTLFSHLRGHLKNHENVPCPFKDCNYRTNVYSSFNTHKSRTHEGSLNFCDDIVSTENDSAPVINTGVLEDEDPAQCPHAGTSAFSESDSCCDTSQLRAQLHHNLSSLFLKMQTVLHVSDMASQEIVDHLTQIFSLSQPLVKDTIQEILQRNHVSPTEAIVNDLVNAVMDTNIFVSATAKGEECPQLNEENHLLRKTTLS